MILRTYFDIFMTWNKSISLYSVAKKPAKIGISDQPAGGGSNWLIPNPNFWFPLHYVPTPP